MKLQKLGLLLMLLLTHTTESSAATIHVPTTTPEAAVRGIQANIVFDAPETGIVEAGHPTPEQSAKIERALTRLRDKEAIGYDEAAYDACMDQSDTANADCEDL